VNVCRSTGDNEGPATIETEKRAARWPPRRGWVAHREELELVARDTAERGGRCGMRQMTSPGRREAHLTCSRVPSGRKTYLPPSLPPLRKEALRGRDQIRLTLASQPTSIRTRIWILSSHPSIYFSNFSLVISHVSLVFFSFSATGRFRVPSSQRAFLLSPDTK